MVINAVNSYIQKIKFAIFFKVMSELYVGVLGVEVF